MLERAQLTGASTMANVLEVYPGAQRALFRRYHIGGCSSCGFKTDETLGQLCERNNNLSVSEVLSYLETSHEEDFKLQLSPAQLQELLNRKENLTLIDIRTREEWETVKLPGAVLLTQEKLQEMLMRAPKQTLIVIYDHFGKLSMDAAAYFAGHGFEKVRALRGGIDAWSQEADSNVPRYRLELN